MGTWGHGSFQNDHARDWCAKLPTAELPGEVLRKVLSTRQTAADEERLLAAAEVVAAASGTPAAGIPKNIASWIVGGGLHVGSELRGVARVAVEAVRAGSALRRLWEKAGELEDWYAVVDDLLRRLRT